ncbi:MAG: caspase family protein [Saprospiraceae bacterium]
MKSVAITLLLLAIAVNAFSQNEKSVRPVGQAPASQSAAPQTRALVVGISDYQHRDIPDLQFAHRDAEALVKWLRSAAGGGLAVDNIHLLTNEQATVAAVVTSLLAMLDECQPGDRFVFYFSGHGDVETRTRTQPGYLLCHDSPANVYMVGALSLRDLQEIVSTLSEKNVAVTLITDACHAGKLAGTSIGGTQATATALARQFANEVKIMSCQPNEFSLEGQQWGGGRGVFSLTLEEGLTGLADKNGDGVVNLFEITRYLQDEVPAQTAPHSQIPMTSGDLQAPLNRVDAAALALLKTEKTGAVASISQTGSKGLEDEVLAAADSQMRNKYLIFKRLVAKGQFFEPKDSCAEKFYQQLADQPALAPLRNLMSRNYAVALLDEVQQAINALLENDPYENNNWRYNPSKYRQYPAYLQRSIELLGEKHYLRRSLEAKRLYFEGYNLFKNVGELEKDSVRRDAFKTQAREKFRQSLQLEPEAAYVFYSIGETFSSTWNYTYNSDSLFFWCEKAVELAPTWLMPLLEISYEYGNGQYNFPQVEYWLKRALAVAPDSYLALERLSWLKQWRNQPDSSLVISKQMIALRPELFNAYSTTAYTLTFMKGEFLESEKYCDQSLALDTDNQLMWGYMAQGINYARTRRLDLAIEHIKKGMAKPGASAHDKGIMVLPLLFALHEKREYAAAERQLEISLSEKIDNPFIRMYLKMLEGKTFLLQNRLDEAEASLKIALTTDPTENGSRCLVWALLGEVESRRGDPVAAEAYFVHVLHAGFTHEKNIFYDEALFRYARFLLDQNRLAESEAMLHEIWKILPKSYFHGYGMALLEAKRGHKTAALDWLEKSLDNFYPSQLDILEEPLFAKIRRAKRFKALMQKHFP